MCEQMLNFLPDKQLHERLYHSLSYIRPRKWRELKKRQETNFSFKSCNRVEQ
ncbi:uncharacterized protein J3R85_000515 [Psidium guajava]|nr:uncharacterized protein J3R85_000515 [Psidium guajava]